jgi:hypothetical protein
MLILILHFDNSEKISCTELFYKEDTTVPYSRQYYEVNRYNTTEKAQRINSNGKREVNNGGKKQRF